VTNRFGQRTRTHFIVRIGWNWKCYNTGSGTTVFLASILYCLNTVVVDFITCDNRLLKGSCRWLQYTWYSFLLFNFFSCYGSSCEMAFVWSRSQFRGNRISFFFFLWLLESFGMSRCHFFWLSAISEGLFVQVLAFQEDFDFSDHLILKMKALQSWTLGTTCPVTRRHTEKTNLHQHHCENFRLHVLLALLKFMAVKMFWECHLKRNLRKF